jgi:hypothetical protein
MNQAKVIRRRVPHSQRAEIDMPAVVDRHRVALRDQMRSRRDAYTETFKLMALT